MTNEFPLSFFLIKEKSRIFFELNQKPTKFEEIIRKNKNKEIKVKYLKLLGISNNNQKMEIIKGSIIEDIDVCSYSPSSKRGSSSSFSGSPPPPKKRKNPDIENLFNKSILSNKINS